MELLDDMTVEAHPPMHRIWDLLDETQRVREMLPVADGTPNEAAEHAALEYIEAFAGIKNAADAAIQEIARELIDRRVPQARIAESAQVTRQTIVRWKRRWKSEESTVINGQQSMGEILADVQNDSPDNYSESLDVPPLDSDSDSGTSR